MRAFTTGEARVWPAARESGGAAPWEPGSAADAIVASEMAKPGTNRAMASIVEAVRAKGRTGIKTSCRRKPSRPGVWGNPVKLDGRHAKCKPSLRSTREPVVQVPQVC